MGKKALARIVFLVVFMIPVAWYLFLQFFGSNTFALEKVSDVASDCEAYKEITIVARVDTLGLVETNYMNRVVFGSNKRSVDIINKTQEYFDCINQSDVDLVLINEKGVWGGYSLDREGVDRLLTELDILKIQESYGKGTSR